MRPTPSRPARRRARGLRLLAALCALAVGCATVPIEDERELGKRQEDSIRHEVRFLKDRVLLDYLKGVGDRIVEASAPHPFDYQFFAIDDDSVNASAGFGGRIYVRTGLILKVRNVSELAGVLAHEVGHISHRHLANNYNRAKATGLARNVLILGALAAGGVRGAQAADFLTGLGGMAYLNTFTRDAEREADDFAIEFLPKAGYDPDGLVTFFETLQAEGEGVHIPVFLRSHPATDDRIAAARQAIAAAALPPGLDVHDNGKLEIIQRRIRLLTGQLDDE